MENKVDVGFGESTEVRWKKKRGMGLPSRSFSDLLVIKPKGFSELSFPMCFRGFGTQVHVAFSVGHHRIRQESRGLLLNILRLTGRLQNVMAETAI